MLTRNTTDADKRLAVVLAAVAGFVDVVGYLTLHHLFTAHMTGNTSKLGVALGHGNLNTALPLAVAPPLFVAGIAAGTLAIVALGLQTAALTEIHGATVRTSYVSGVLTHLAQGIARRGRAASGGPDRLRLLGAIWIAYVVGATGAAYTLRQLAIWCLAIPVAVLLVAAAAFQERRAR